MIDKQEYYYGAGLIKLIDDPRFLTIKKNEDGYIVNDATFIYLKYRTKSMAPWSFTITKEEGQLLQKHRDKFTNVVIGLVCGGDGVCAVSFDLAKELLGGTEGSISVKRKFREQYSVKGPAQKMKGKVSPKEWQERVFCK
ncbi:MAG: hypothetical protein GY853_05980 [PVC group bacterium]|nr:hypothetical protein [PVC group bacterium]